MKVKALFVGEGIGLLLSGSMVLVIRRHNRNQAQGDSLHLIGQAKH